MGNIHPNFVTSVEARYIDCCLPDYFQGSNAEEVLAVPMHADITYREAYERCKENFHESSGWFDQVAGSGTFVEDALRALFSTVEDVNAVADFAKYIDSDDENGETVYLYIGLHAESNL